MVHLSINRDLICCRNCLHRVDVNCSYIEKHGFRTIRIYRLRKWSMEYYGCNRFVLKPQQLSLFEYDV